MKEAEVNKILRQLDRVGRYVFTTHDMPKLFPEDNPKTLAAGLRRLVEKGILQRVCRGIYVNQQANSFDSYTIERIAQALRRSDYNYVSLESILSEYGALSQIPLDRLTVMTTGRQGIYQTPYGVIEFTHTICCKTCTGDGDSANVFKIVIVRINVIRHYKLPMLCRATNAIPRN